MFVGSVAYKQYDLDCISERKSLCVLTTDEAHLTLSIHSPNTLDFLSTIDYISFAFSCHNVPYCQHRNEGIAIDPQSPECALAPGLDIRGDFNEFMHVMNLRLKLFRQV